MEAVADLEAAHRPAPYRQQKPASQVPVAAANLDLSFPVPDLTVVTQSEYPHGRAGLWLQGVPKPGTSVGGNRDRSFFGSEAGVLKKTVTTARKGGAHRSISLLLAGRCLSYSSKKNRCWGLYLLSPTVDTQPHCFLPFAALQDCHSSQPVLKASGNVRLRFLPSGISTATVFSP